MSSSVPSSRENRLVSRAIGTIVALSLFPAAIAYFAAVPLLLLIFALGGTSLEVVALMGVAGVAALACVVLAIQILIKPQRSLVLAGVTMSLIAFALYLPAKMHWM